MVDWALRVRQSEAMALFGDLRRAVALSPKELAFVGAALCLAPPMGWSIRLFGFRPVVELARRTPNVRFLPGEMATVRAERLVSAAFRYAPTPSGCLPQSLVQLVLQRAAGVDARLVIGVRRPGPTEVDPQFAAHAWVEAPGENRAADDQPIANFSGRGPTGRE